MGTATNSSRQALKNRLSLKRIGWLYPIFRDVYFHHGLLAAALAARPRPETTPPVTSLPKSHPLHSTPLTTPDPLEPGNAAVPWNRSLCSRKGIITMATHAQIKANGNNAKKSTGPRTEDGKARVAKNALKHGLLARDAVLPGEDPADFDSQLTALEADIHPANSLEFELVRQIADAQWRMRRLTRLETGFIAAAVDDTRRHAEKHRPDTLLPGYDGETMLLGSAMLDRTQAFVHLARYDGHLSRRFFRAVKQLGDLRRDERKARESRPSADPDPYRGRYVPAQAPPPIDTPNPAAGRIGFRASSEPASQSLTQTTKQTQCRPTPVKSTPSRDEPRSVDLAVEIRGLSALAHRRDKRIGAANARVL